MKCDVEMKLALAAWAFTGITLAQGLNPAQLLKLPTDNWPSYNGDYSGRRFSPLAHINSTNVTAMTLAWTLGTARSRRP
jgi:alcohol dehydrogenase (cytochrome c)